MARAPEHQRRAVDWTPFNEALTARIKAALPVDELARHSGAQLNKQGVGRCPLHDDSSPSFKAGHDHWTCYAGCGGGDVLDLIGAMYDNAASFVDRLRVGCQLAGIDYDAEQAAFLGHAPRKNASRAPLLPPLKDVQPIARKPQLYEWEERAARHEFELGMSRDDAELRATSELGAQARAALGWIVAQLDVLDEGARRWLENERGLDAELCAHFGLRSSSAREWRGLVMEAADMFGADVLMRAGVMRAEDGDHHRAGDPFPRVASFIVMPYLDERGELDTIRLRNTTPGAGAKMLGLLNPNNIPGLSWQPGRPFLEGAALEVARRTGCPLYVCEGELDALAVWQRGRPALATYGAGVWHPGWSGAWKGLDRVFVLLDRDERAGVQLAGRISDDVVFERVQQEGAPPVVRFKRAPDGAGVKDANDMLRAGLLGIFLHKCEAD